MVIIKEFFPSQPQLISEYIENRRKQLRDGSSKFNVKLLYKTNSENDKVIDLLKAETEKNQAVTPQIIEMEEPHNKKVNMFLEDAERHIENALSFHKSSGNDEALKLDSTAFVRRITASKKLQNSIKNSDAYCHENKEDTNTEFYIEQVKFNKKSADIIVPVDEHDETTKQILPKFNLNLSQLNSNTSKKSKRNFPKKHKIVSQYNEKVLNSPPTTLKTPESRPPNNTPTNSLSSYDYNTCGRMRNVELVKSSHKKIKESQKPKRNIGDVKIETKTQVDRIKLKVASPISRKPKRTFAKTDIPNTKANTFVNKESIDLPKSSKKSMVSKNSLEMPKTQLNRMQKYRFSDKGSKEIIMPVVTVQMF